MAHKVTYVSFDFTEAVERLLSSALDRRDLSSSQRVRIFNNLFELLTGVTRAIDGLSGESLDDFIFILAKAASIIDQETL